MKNVYFFVALLAISAGAFAKGEYESLTTAGPIVNGKFPHFGNQVVSTTAGGGTTPAKVSLRLIGRTYTKFSAGAFVPVDSYYYRYENDRGGVLANDNIDNDETLLFTESIHFNYDQNTALFVNRLMRIQKYNSDDKIEFLTYQPWKASLSKFTDSARYHYGYENGQMKTSTFEQNYGGMWTNSIESGISYSGQLVTAMASDFYKVEFKYDASARLIEMSDGESSGNGVWQNKEKHNYEYTGSNVQKHVLSEWNAQGNTWMNKKSWHYAYNNDGKLISEEEKDFNGSTWTNVIRHEYTYDGKGNMVTDLKKVWNSSANAFVEASKEDWVYNIQNLPELITTSTWSGSGWVHTNDDTQYRLYYENFFPSDVKKIAGKDELSVYPVPATDVVNLKMDVNGTQDITVSLYDIRGAMVYATSYDSARELQAAIPVSSLPAGSYILRIMGNSTNLTRQIIVQH